MAAVEKRHGDETEREVSALDRLARETAPRMLERALETEVESYIERHRNARDEGGHTLVVRNGRSPARSVVVGAGVLGVRARRVNDKRVVDGDRQKSTRLRKSAENIDFALIAIMKESRRLLPPVKLQHFESRQRDARYVM